MYLIVGLGNPGDRYKGTRHNIGFDVINMLSLYNNICINKEKFMAYFAQEVLFNKKVILAKPQTYMNLSGESILEIMKYYKIDMDKLIVIYDDISLNIGEIKIKEKGSSGGHNGIKNIIDNLKTDKFKRIKIGIGKKPNNLILSEYVLEKFKIKEVVIINESMKKACEAIEDILKNSIEYAMNKYNKNKSKKCNIEVD